MRFNGSRSGIPTVVILLFGFTAAGFAQIATATLVGTVSDPQGAAVGNAAIRVTNHATGQERTENSDSQGNFTISQLPPSTYTVEVSATGFANSRLSEIALNVGDRRALPVALRVAGVAESVQVTAERELINTSPGISNLIDREFVENQPLNGRTFQSLITLSPGVVTTPTHAGSQGQFSVNGQCPSTNYVTVDGVSANFSSTGASNLYENAGVWRGSHAFRETFGLGG